MEDFDLSDLLAYQLSNTKILSYDNELATVLGLQNDKNSTLRRRMTKAWLNALKLKYDQSTNVVKESVQHAVRLRQEGNVVYRSKSENRSLDLITASQRYTEAIFKAPANTEALALAYANRAMVLQELGYYKQSYDDCCCALETEKYPQRLLHKIKVRQAFCTLYLKELKLLAGHLVELEACDLNNSFERNVNELREGLKILSNEMENENNIKRKNKADYATNQKDVSTTRATQIIDSNDPIRGRYMIAIEPINSGEVIFKEKVNAFVPVGGCQMCQQCGAMLMIPLPCNLCNGQVIYCSLKCRKVNTKVHQHECKGHGWELFKHIGIGFLALRLMLEELPTLLPIVANEKELNELWIDLITPTKQLHTQNNIDYLNSLLMVTHLKKMPLSDITHFALMADFLIVYLKEYTAFFICLKDTKLKQSDWELLCGALILRHIGQLIVNAHTAVSISPTYYDIYSTSNLCGMLLVPNLWSNPFHLRRGMLHVLSECGKVSAVNLPYLSICNHACAPTLRHKFSGRYFNALADKDIRSGDEIFNCYSTTHRNSGRDDRREYLKIIYHFHCTCVFCERKDPDKDNIKHHLYKCQNAKCRKEFASCANESQDQAWWRTVPVKSVSCPFCTNKQNFEWYAIFKHLLKHTSSLGKRIELFNIFDKVDGILLGLHTLKYEMGLDLLRACFDSYMAGYLFTDNELSKITKTLQFCLEVIVDVFNLQSLEYAATMTFLWDLVALNKYNPSETDTNNMLKALNVMSDEYKLVFLNYYKDFIDPLY